MSGVKALRNNNVKVLFVHQNFPGQYKHLAPALAEDPGNEVVALGLDSNLGRLKHPGVREVGYSNPLGAGPETHHYLHQLESAVRRGQEVVRTAEKLNRGGFQPDLVCCHPGWGEGLYLRDLWPRARLLYYFEFYYHAYGYDIGFDPEFPRHYDQKFKARTRNALHHLNLNVADWGITPTHWQHASMPEEYRHKISVIFDGIDTGVAAPSREARVPLPNGASLTSSDEVVTFVNRNLEPYRGYHIFMRALPKILADHPRAQVVIVGGDGESYGPKVKGAQSHKAKYMAEVVNEIDRSRVHFTGHVPFATYISILQISSVHVYLTYPFVLSWALLEAMSTGCAVVASSTGPVEEVIRDGDNGLLFDFFDTDALARRVHEVLDNPDRMEDMRTRARQTVVERYDLNSVCLPRQMILARRLGVGETPSQDD